MLDKIRLIEIEINSYCNRKCSFCPNSFLNRSDNVDLDEDSYLNILNELHSIDYNNIISYSRYNEPMSNPTLFKKRVKQAKEILPNAKLVSNTNGDYFNDINICELLIDELTIMDYDCKGETYYIDKLNKMININITSVEYPFIKAKYKEMNILIFCDWLKHVELEDRGGSLLPLSTINDIDVKWKGDRGIRNKPCLEPKYFVGIDYTGSVVPCCHIRSDNKHHRDYILGNINDNSLNDVLNSKKAIEFRKSAINMDFKLPCIHCHKEPGRYTKDNPNMKYN